MFSRVCVCVCFCRSSGSLSMTSLAHVFTYSHSLSVSNACKQLRSLGIASAEATRLFRSCFFGFPGLERGGQMECISSVTFDMEVITLSDDFRLPVWATALHEDLSKFAFTGSFE